MKIVYFGFNSFKSHKRGVENVIEFQSHSFNFCQIYYFHWGDFNKIYKNNNFICISLKKNFLLPFFINHILFRIITCSTIIHSHNPIFSFLSWYKTDILTVHDGLYYYSKMTNNKFKYCFFLLEKLVYLRSNIIQFISNFAKSQSLIPNYKKFIIISNTSHLESNYLVNDIIKCNNSTDQNVLVVRSIEERARFDLLLDVAEINLNSDILFKVAGKGPLLDYYIAEAEKRKINNIIFMGYVSTENLILLYQNCDIVLTIADYGEGFGLPIIESYLFNKPVVASNCCAIPEIIIDDSFLFLNNAMDVNEKLQHALNYKTEFNFREYYDNNFSNYYILNKFNELYSSFI